MINCVTVIGAGVMGHGIAQTFATAGMKVKLFDLNEEALLESVQKIESNLSLCLKNNFITLEDKEKTLRNINVTNELYKAVQYSDFIIEAIPEILKLKHELFSKLESLCDPHVIIASNTSTLSLSSLIENVVTPERFIIAHFLNPAPLVPLVEVVKTEKTSQEVVDETLELLRSVGKSPILLKKEIDGFIANRLQAALMREAFSLVNDGVVDAKDLDKVITEGPGFRWAFIGPIEAADFGGLDTWKRVIDNLAPNLDHSQKAPEFIDTLVKEGNLGTKTGKGIFSYEDVSVNDKIELRDTNFLKLLTAKKKKCILKPD